VGSPLRCHAAGVAPAASLPRAPQELFEAVRANPGEAGLRAQFDQAVQDLMVVAAEMRALEAECKT
jgi:hypothetical protein